MKERILALRKKWLSWSLRRRVLLSAGTAAGLFLGGGLLWATLAVNGAVGEGCPSVSDLLGYRPPEATRVFARDGSVVADLSPQRRVVLDISDIPPLVRESMIAVEDRRFWDHGGVDPRSFARALWRNLTSLSIREGFSTITMQLARSVFPEQLPMGEKVGRKVCEVHLAGQIEDELDKRDILALYLNQIYLGAGLYGVEAAAQGYFGKSVSELDAAETALLVALVRSPEGYNPRKHPERAIRRRNLVLDVMADAGVVDPATAEAARRSRLVLAPPVDASAPAPYFVAAVRREIRARFGEDADVQGLRVFTGLDPVLQQASGEALTEQIAAIEDGQLGQYSHPKGPPAEPDAPVLQGMVVIMDPHTGDVRALVGGRDFQSSQFDRAFQARRQPGSAFKPVIYAAALESGLPTTARLETAPVEVSAAGSPTWRPGDHVADSVETLSVRNALAISSNHAAVRLGQWLGEERVAAMGRRLGLSTPIPEYPSIFLGSAEVVPAELVAAFAAFGNGGYRVQPQLIVRVEDRDGAVLWQAHPPTRQALDPGVAFLTLTLLEEVVNSGTAAVIRRKGFWLPAAGKTGTTNDGKDVWFIGMTPDLAAGVWLGFDRPRP
ncbi:MAG: penicillin-binding protein 1A, partial [Gemmatimonadetes bacterium]|nr:penicillin-binding protein 1A [Gemmatimonadota bacterium]NIQ51982.1 penicillin-binding protein 1A [Gemmatimonadota bacterium]NIU72082.1 penicillin-binding protein 1A [Gammaproteobacteria bacterium]NIX42649.1 penicillin-binding protein 1A [Gemmatimonadota bacterium]NIY06809.1 penicillin-binding protein 1A [Gemmatimonadota bacterium]